MTVSKHVSIVPTGVANLASIRAALDRHGATYCEKTDADAIRTAERVILPGVGAFAAAMENLNKDGLGEALIERINEGRPTLSVCLGLHLLNRTSEESPGVKGLGILPSDVKRFNGDVQVPQFGWNRMEASSGCKYLKSGYVYFANSFCVRPPLDGWACATAVHGVEFVAACEREDVLACQFHPELSGQFGSELLFRWLEGVKSC